MGFLLLLSTQKALQIICFDARTFGFVFLWNTENNCAHNPLWKNISWESLDIFIKQVSFEFLSINHPNINYGYLLLQCMFYLIFRRDYLSDFMPEDFLERINHSKKVSSRHQLKCKVLRKSLEKKREKRKNWFLRPTGILVIVVSGGGIILSYLSPELEENIAMSVVIMLVRSLIITFVWYTLLAPVMRKLFPKFVRNKEIRTLPGFRRNYFYVPKIQEDS
ncbi:MAG: hypothetical protein U5J96_05355 [Ignavibacteriaceae bacterium]|nr:hypothetical protein [Ignavibacteriaceae bacterium]